MSLVTEYFESHMVPRLTIGNYEDRPDGYAYSQEISVGTDGYVLDLRLNTCYSLLTEAQDLYFAILSDDEIAGTEDEDEADKLALLDTSSGVKRGHKLLADERMKIATTRRCSTLVMKAAASTATVTIAPLGSYLDDKGGR